MVYSSGPQGIWEKNIKSLKRNKKESKRKNSGLNQSLSGNWENQSEESNNLQRNCVAIIDWNGNFKPLKVI